MITNSDLGSSPFPASVHIRITHRRLEKPKDRTSPNIKLHSLREYSRFQARVFSFSVVPCRNDPILPNLSGRGGGSGHDAISSSKALRLTAILALCSSHDILVGCLHAFFPILRASQISSLFSCDRCSPDTCRQ